MELREKVVEVLHAVEVGKCTVADARDAILSLIDEERREMVGAFGIIQVGLQPGGSPPPSITALARWIVDSVQKEREAAEARCAKLVEGLEDFVKTLHQHKVGDEMPVTLFIAFDVVLAAAKEGT